jgi:nucleoside-triphosphatase THEP1
MDLTHDEFTCKAIKKNGYRCSLKRSLKSKNPLVCAIHNRNKDKCILYDEQTDMLIDNIIDTRCKAIKKNGYRCSLKRSLKSKNPLVCAIHNRNKDKCILYDEQTDMLIDETLFSEFDISTVLINEFKCLKI